VLVHRPRAGEQLAKALGADRDRDRPIADQSE
jgi:hypothetical protein